MSKAILPPKKPKPVIPVLYGLVVVLNAACAVMYFLGGKSMLGWVWVALTVVWLALIPSTIKTHRMNVDFWRLRLRTYEAIERSRVQTLAMIDRLTLKRDGGPS